MGAFRLRSLVRTLLELEEAELVPFTDDEMVIAVDIVGEGRVFEGVGEGRGIAWFAADAADTTPPSGAFGVFSLILGYMAVAMADR